MPPSRLASAPHQCVVEGGRRRPRLLLHGRLEVGHHLGDVGDDLVDGSLGLATCVEPAGDLGGMALTPFGVARTLPTVATQPGSGLLAAQR